MNNRQYIDMMRNNTQQFLDTYHLSLSKFASVTDAMVENTEVYKDAAIAIESVEKNENMQIEFIDGGTVNTAYKLKEENIRNRVAMLNFADAKRPGGWVVDGAPTQEENICRCTNMYVGLIQDRCMKEYYAVNDKYHTEAHLDEEYTDALIYLPNAVIFKDDTDYRVVPPMFVDIITSPAPCGNVDNVVKVLEHRIEGILKSAYAHDVTDIVLGAWGCGAFGQSPEVVARCFANVLIQYSIFERVIFAIKDTPGVKTSNAKRFKKAFLQRYTA